MSENVTHLPNAHDRDFFRTDGYVYLYVDAAGADQAGRQDANGVFIPTFMQDEDDICGLSIDAFREQIAVDDPPNKDYFFRMQQLMSMIKRYFDAEIMGKKHKLYKKVPINISGSGMSFLSGQEHAKGENLRVSMFFPRFPYTFVSVFATVVKSVRDDEGKIWVKCQFQGLSQKNEDDILRFVNQCQRDNKNKGL